MYLSITDENKTGCINNSPLAKKCEKEQLLVHKFPVAKAPRNSKHHFVVGHPLGLLTAPLQAAGSAQHPGHAQRRHGRVLAHRYDHHCSFLWQAGGCAS
eukprot:167638-Pyramimonas_sp.AAC.1